MQNATENWNAKLCCDCLSNFDGFWNFRGKTKMLCRNKNKKCPQRSKRQKPCKRFFPFCCLKEMVKRVSFTELLLRWKLEAIVSADRCKSLDSRKWVCLLMARVRLWRPLPPKCIGPSPVRSERPTPVFWPGWVIFISSSPDDGRDNTQHGENNGQVFRKGLHKWTPLLLKFLFATSETVVEIWSLLYTDVH